MKIAVGLSGGVDSSVAAALLKEEGHEVIGVTMKVCDAEKYPATDKPACFGGNEEDDIEDARKIAAHLDIPFYVVDLSDEYEELIISYFKNEYLAGRTPNPCVKCNQQIKFDLLLERSRNKGVDFDYFATGHYAKVEFDEQKKRYLLKKAAYIEKDQTYFLSMLKQSQLEKIKLPLGEYTKQQVRELAAKYGLFTEDKIESQDFYAGDYADLFEETPGEGPIKNRQGKVLGTHKGIINYTIGQRRGLGIGANTPLYVLEINAKENSIIVGEENELYSNSFTLVDVNWMAFDRIPSPLETAVKIRYKSSPMEASVIKLEDGNYRVSFLTPQKAVTPGQVAVFYDGDILLGGGYIIK